MQPGSSHSSLHVFRSELYSASYQLMDLIVQSCRDVSAFKLILWLLLIEQCHPVEEEHLTELLCLIEYLAFAGIDKKERHLRLPQYVHVAYHGYLDGFRLVRSLTLKTTRAIGDWKPDEPVKLIMPTWHPSGMWSGTGADLEPAAGTHPR